MSVHEASSHHTKPVWLPFSCPSCRGLFRSLSDQEGVTQCPLCDARVRIHPPEDVSAYRTESSHPHRPEELRSGESSTWSNHEKVPKRGKKKNFILLACAALTLVALIIVALLLISPDDATVVDETTSAPERSEPQGPLVEVSNEDLEAAFQLAGDFLSAPTIEDLEPLIRKPDTVMPQIREYYRNQEYSPPNFKSVDRAASAETIKRFVSFAVIMPDYSAKPIAVEFTPEGPKVDWASWVGYCEIPWNEFVADQVTTPTLVRVRATPVFYYNFDFSSDEDWRAYRLFHPDSEDPLYGYAPADADFLQDLPRSSGSATVTLKIHFPENPRTDDQVIISDFVCEGWLPDVAK